jgi:endonuclease G, mitochondrial
LPELTSAGQKVAAKLDDGSHELKYHKFSLVMHKHRRLALFTAANVDWREQSRKVNGRKPSRKELDGTGGAGEKWVTDERLPENQQLPDEFYTKDGGAFDKGHLVRRDDVCWGSSFKDIQKANGDTFHTTNCSPQVAGFNRSTEGEDNWGDLEDLVQKETDAERVIIFSGPVLDPDDLRFEGIDKRGDVQIQIPSKFWKIVLANDEDGAKAFGFVLDQDLADVPLEFAVPQRWRRYLRSIAEIERLLFGFASLDWLKAYDQSETTSGRRMASRVKR